MLPRNLVLQRAQGADAGSGSAAQADNPLANFTAVNLQNYYIGKLTSPDREANQFRVRYAQPVAIDRTKWIFRASLPLDSYPVAPGLGIKTGLGDLNAFAAYLIDTGNKAVSFS